MAFHSGEKWHFPVGVDTESVQGVESSNVSEEGNELPGETVEDILEKDDAVKLGA